MTIQPSADLLLRKQTRTLFTMATFALLLVVLLVQQALADASCLPYAPGRVILTGELQRLTFAGPPNFESIPGGDKAETGFYLALENPICTTGENDSPDAYPQQGIQRVQLVLERHKHAALAPSLGKKISLSGQLVARHSGHHHAPLLLVVATDEPLRH